MATCKETIIHSTLSGLAHFAQSMDIIDDWDVEVSPKQLEHQNEIFVITMLLNKAFKDNRVCNEFGICTKMDANKHIESFYPVSFGKTEADGTLKLSRVSMENNQPIFEPVHVLTAEMATVFIDDTIQDKIAIIPTDSGELHFIKIDIAKYGSANPFYD